MTEYKGENIMVKQIKETDYIYRVIKPCNVAKND
jgi:hypothetical protein